MLQKGKLPRCLLRLKQGREVSILAKCNEMGLADDKVTSCMAKMWFVLATEIS